MDEVSVAAFQGMDEHVTSSKFYPWLLFGGLAIKTGHHTQMLSSPRARALDSQDPLLRLFARETSVGRKLLIQVRKDLADVIKVCEGALKQTNHLRSLMSHLTKGTISAANHSVYH